MRSSEAPQRPRWLVRHFLANYHDPLFYTLLLFCGVGNAILDVIVNTAGVAVISGALIGLSIAGLLSFIDLKGNRNDG